MKVFQPKTRREKAMCWWNGLTLEERFYKTIGTKKIRPGDDATRHPDTLTGREIEEIWVIEILKSLS